MPIPVSVRGNGRQRVEVFRGEASGVQVGQVGQSLDSAATNRRVLMFPGSGARLTALKAAGCSVCVNSRVCCRAHHCACSASK